MKKDKLHPEPGTRVRNLISGEIATLQGQLPDILQIDPDAIYYEVNHIGEQDGKCGIWPAEIIEI